MSGAIAANTAFIEREQRIDAQIDAIADAAGALNVANARLVAVMADVLTERSWAGSGVHTPIQWLTYHAGITTARARTIIDVAARRASFPVVIGRFDAGELSLEQVAELVKAPAWADAKLVDWALVATPARIRRSIKFGFTPDDYDTPDTPDTTDTPDGHNTGETDRDDADHDDRDGAAPTADEDRAGGPDSRATGDTKPDDRGGREWVSTGVTDEHRWRIRGELDLDHGTLIDNALTEARQRLWERGQRTISLADCLVEICERFLDGIDAPIRRDRSKVWLHLDADTGAAVTGVGVRAPDSIRDLICCDGTIQPVWEHDGHPVNVGRSQRIVPERTRRVVTLRDGGCRVPGCTHTRILEIHHIIHWLDGGATDTANLVTLCPKHHRLHHHGRLDITGDADQPDGLTFTTDNTILKPCGRPNPPPHLPRPPNRYTPPRMGRVDWNWVGLGWTRPPTT